MVKAKCHRGILTLITPLPPPIPTPCLPLRVGGMRCLVRLPEMHQEFKSKIVSLMLPNEWTPGPNVRVCTQRATKSVHTCFIIQDNRGEEQTKRTAGNRGHNHDVSAYSKSLRAYVKLLWKSSSPPAVSSRQRALVVIALERCCSPASRSLDVPRLEMRSNTSG